MAQQQLYVEEAFHRKSQLPGKEGAQHPSSIHYLYRLSVGVAGKLEPTPSESGQEVA